MYVSYLLIVRRNQSALMERTLLSIIFEKFLDGCYSCTVNLILKLAKWLYAERSVADKKKIKVSVSGVKI